MPSLKGKLIAPMKKEYLSYSFDETLVATEQELQRLEADYREAEKRKSFFSNKIDYILLNEDENKILELLDEQEFLELCKCDYDMYRMKCYIYIFAREKQIGINGNLPNAKDFMEAIGIYQEAIFFLKRFELGYVLPESEELLFFIIGLHFSYIFFGELICSDHVYDKIVVCDKLFAELLKCRMKKEAVLLLFYTSDKLVNNEAVILCFTQLLLDAGEMELGLQMIQKLREPSEEIKKLQRLLMMKVKTVNLGEGNE